MTLLRWLLGLRRKDDVMSSAWLHEQRLSERVEFHGVSWTWPARPTGNRDVWRKVEL